MKLFGFTLNNVTMLALVLMVGVVIDDAIVVLENVFHCIEEKGLDPMQASIAGDARDRAGGAGDDDLAGDRVLAGVVSVERDGADAVPVRHHGDGGDPGFDAGELYADAHDVQQAAEARHVRIRTAPASRRGWYGLDGAGLYVVAAAVDAVSLGGAAAVGRRRSRRTCWLYDLVKQDYIPTNVDESEFEVSVNAREGASLTSMDGGAGARREGDSARFRASS